MAKKEKPIQTSDESALVEAAKVIGTAAGKIARLAGARPDGAEPAKSQKVPKFSKKNKPRLPRKEKKALQKNSK